MIICVFSLARHPLPPVDLNEIVEGPRFLRQLLRVRRPNVSLACYWGIQSLGRIRRERTRRRRCQVGFILHGGARDSVIGNLISCEWDDGTQWVHLDVLPDILLVPATRSVNSEPQRWEGGPYISFKHIQTADIRFGQPEDERSANRSTFRFQVVIKHGPTLGVRQDPRVVCMLLAH